MKNVTISVDEDVLRWAKVTAAQNDTSVSRMLGDELRLKMLNDKQYARARKLFQSRQPTALKLKGTPYPSRDSLYER